VVALAAIVPAAADAHAAFADASPEPGARVESSPAQIMLAFTEPLDHALSTAHLAGARSGHRVPTVLSFGAGNRMVLRPSRPLPTGAYEVLWHTVSIRDGHTLEGSLGFGVRPSAVGGAAQLEQSPLARGGWLRVALRALGYGALFFFGAGLICGMLLASPAGPSGWLVAGEGVAAGAAPVGAVHSGEHDLGVPPQFVLPAASKAYREPSFEPIYTNATERKRISITKIVATVIRV